MHVYFVDNQLIIVFFCYREWEKEGAESAPTPGPPAYAYAMMMWIKDKQAVALYSVGADIIPRSRGFFPFVCDGVGGPKSF